MEQPRLMEKKMEEAQAEADKTIERLKLEVCSLDLYRISGLFSYPVIRPDCWERKNDKEGKRGI